MVNVEMTNAWLVNNARKANNLARNEAVRRSRAEAAEERAKAKAKKAAENAKKAADNAKKAQANAEKAAANAKKAQAEALAKNVKNKLIALSRRNINKREMAKQGRKIYIQAVKTKLLHPNKGANKAISQNFFSTYDEFTKFVSQN
jgi:membrane protein involved in colicin uptake